MIQLVHIVFNFFFIFFFSLVFIFQRFHSSRCKKTVCNDANDGIDTRPCLNIVYLPRLWSLCRSSSNQIIRRSERKTTFCKWTKNKNKIKKFWMDKPALFSHFRTVLTGSVCEAKGFSGSFTTSIYLLITLNGNIVWALPIPVATLMFDHFSSLLILIYR